MLCCSRKCCAVVFGVLLALVSPILYNLWRGHVWEPSYGHRTHFFPRGEQQESVFAIVSVFPSNTHPGITMPCNEILFQNLKALDWLKKPAKKFSTNNRNTKSLYIQFYTNPSGDVFSDPDNNIDAEGFIVNVQTKEQAQQIAVQIQLFIQQQQLKGVDDISIRAIEFPAASYSGIVHASLPADDAINSLFFYRFHSETPLPLETYGYSDNKESRSTFFVPVHEVDDQGTKFQKHLLWFVTDKRKILFRQQLEQQLLPQIM